ncbi:glutamyl aminopeptidase-like isoform X2 [Biomphalaria pfeifferi]|uniref:Aminopeptidase n=1 Tax=Biomphalaria pfeifferi TaxID=112525 RepID=A0AAD8ASQ9_BIOPF|nr:glutamyl aminopeptidase-like isoform X2 [Biomphalaria pfeifferi]
MKEHRLNRANRRLLILLSAIFLLIVVIVGAVVWKVTKDAYQVGTVSGLNDKTALPDLTTPPATRKTTYSSEELRQKPWLSLRMPRNVLPIHYDIIMFPDFYGNGSTFYGNETIELQITSPTQFILLHVHTVYMNVTSANVVDNLTGTELDVARTFYYLPNEYFVIETSRPVDRPVRVKVQFEGSLTKTIVGIYKSTYYNTITKKQSQLATSKFEPTFARQAFPCFDEPNLKAEFTLSLLHRPEYIALSNMPLSGQPRPSDHADSLYVSSFQRSVKMSTYLVCFIVCDFNFTETVSNSGINIRVYSTPDKVDQTLYALDMAKHTLDTYEKMFNMSYPLPKQDLIAIPDFVSGAMEHWGLMTFRENRLLYNPNSSSIPDQINVASVVAHEMAHQWFGNIVTMDWWNDLWLNEGFASFMEYLGVDGNGTDWDILNKFLDFDLFPVMTEDSQISSHPIIVDVHSPNEVNSVFDAISYSKGASVIRMLEALIGKKTFFDGVSKYLNDFQWGNARTDDLWQALSDVSEDYNVKHVMDTWTIQDGFPYINLSLNQDSSGQTIISATQKRFLISSSSEVDESKSPFKYKWYVSLDYLTSENVTGKEIMDMKNINVTKDFDLSSPNSWIKCNHGQMGFYIVLYPNEMWLKFSNYLQETPSSNWLLSNADRAGLINDVFLLAESGKLSYDTALEMLSYLSQENDYLPWTTANRRAFSYISTMLSQDSSYILWKKFLAASIKPIIERLGFEDTGTNNERQLRSLLLDKGCSVEISSIVRNVTLLFRHWLDQNIKPSANIKRVVYNYGMKYGGTDSDWQLVWDKYLTESSPQEKEALAVSLSRVQKPYLISKLLDNMKTQNGIKTQDFFTLVTQVSANQAANHIVWDWARQNYQFFTERFTINNRNFGRMVFYIVRNYATEVKLQEVKDLFSRFPEAGAGERFRRMAIETIEKNISWMKVYKAVIANWLQTHVAK